MENMRYLFYNEEKEREMSVHSYKENRIEQINVCHAATKPKQNI